MKKRLSLTREPLFSCREQRQLQTMMNEGVSKKPDSSLANSVFSDSPGAHIDTPAARRASPLGMTLVNRRKYETACGGRSLASGSSQRKKPYCRASGSRTEPTMQKGPGKSSLPICFRVVLKHRKWALSLIWNKALLPNFHYPILEGRDMLRRNLIGAHNGHRRLQLFSNK